MRKLIYIVIAVIIIFICIVARCDTYDKAKRQYYKLENEFNSVSEALLVLPTEYLYIDVENKESVEKEILNWGYSIPISEINILLDAGVDGIMKNGAAVMYKLGNKTNRAYGIAYFQYYFSTQEPKYELITAVNAIEEKNKNWYYYENR